MFDQFETLDPINMSIRWHYTLDYMDYLHYTMYEDCILTCTFDYACDLNIYNINSFNVLNVTMKEMGNKYKEKFSRKHQ